MGESIRVSGKTVNDAVMNAAIELNTTSDRIEYKVIEHESRGFLGIGAKDAVIEASVRQDAETAAPENSNSGSDHTAETTVRQDIGKTAPESLNSASGDAAETAVRKSVQTAAPERRESETESSSESSDPAENHGLTRNHGLDGNHEFDEDHGFDGNDGFDESHHGAGRNRRASDIKVLEHPEEAISRAETFLKDVFGSMGMEVQLSSSYDGECLNVSMEGEEMGLLIGKRGQTLDSLQYLTSLVVNKGKPYYVRVKLDTENYRERRKATLENLAKNIAIKVKKTRQPVYLEPMNPYERRIIHSALQSDPFVTTHSEGEEPDRKVVVTLKKDADLELLERKYGSRGRRDSYRGGRGYGRRRGGYGRREEYSGRNSERRADSDPDFSDRPGSEE